MKKFFPKPLSFSDLSIIPRGGGQKGGLEFRSDSAGVNKRDEGASGTPRHRVSVGLDRKDT